MQVPVNDPALLIPAMATATRHLGFGVTCNLTYEAPYAFARRMSTLDHLTGGRVGWNIVTGYLDSAARAAGLSGKMAHDDRYDLADEYMALVYQLWEGSWEDGAVLGDRARGIYADPAKVHAVHHAGPQYKVDALHLAGALAAAHARAVPGRLVHARPALRRHACRVRVPQRPRARRASGRIVDDIRAQAVSLGRRADDVQVFLGATVVTGRTDAEARDKYEDYRRHASNEAALAHAAASMGIDFAKYGLDEPIAAEGSQAIVSNVEAMTRSAGPKPGPSASCWSRWRWAAASSRWWARPSTSPTRSPAWTAEAGVDGFNLSRTVVPECYDDFISLVVPILQERGVYKTSYAEGTYRRKLFGRDRLPASHAAAAWRRGAGV